MSDETFLGQDGKHAMGGSNMEVGFAGNLGKGNPRIVMAAHGAQERNCPMKALGALP
jgi:hypothetical protein